MSLKLEIEGVMLNVVSGYAPQVGCVIEEKERFWSELDEVIESIPTGERVVIGADFNGHVGEGNTGDEEVMGKFGVKERNLEGQMVVDFAKRMDMAVVNTYVQKREEHRVTYKSGGRSTQDVVYLCAPTSTLVSHSMLLPLLKIIVNHSHVHPLSKVHYHLSFKVPFLNSKLAHHLLITCVPLTNMSIKICSYHHSPPCGNTLYHLI
ncbi:hypothetical protein PDJAM_G00254210 [Pangasius djambal]|uniref:Uncharacterized protein n=1 Tax=Pangasius djambal TaxID=1691987 RepID=A0ACC5YJZ8_9TELE|nr:hypothetical protein [Pangasius djambal]